MRGRVVDGSRAAGPRGADVQLLHPQLGRQGVGHEDAVPVGSVAVGTASQRSARGDAE
jgi:hypothetical protein